VKRSKCSFGVMTVVYLGHIISAQGVAMDAEKVEVVQAWSLPQTVRDFLNLTGHYCKFIRSCGDIAAPSMQLLKKEAFSWTPVAVAVLNTLKTTLTTTSVL
jgi:hypothetical protein